MPYLDLNHERAYYALCQGRLVGGSPIVLIHGAGESHLAWPAGLRRLPNANVYALDLPGHGKSGGDGCTSIQAYVDWVINFLDGLGLRRVVLVGHSMGGAIAQLFGLQHPDRTAGLVLIGTGAKLRVAPQLLALALTNLEAAAELISQQEWGLGVPDQIKRLGKQQTLAMRPEVLHNDFVACNSFDVMEQLHTLSAPTLIIGGTIDQLTPIKHAAFLAERIPDARLVTVPDAGHMVMIEAQTIVTQAVEQFVSHLE